ncbi:ciliary-associated calcium-binding coiled-coil protein 1 isoform X1 [Pocillopora verrucosa]|uniref:ciliary-associated calcium-binding coiled-coil protein 1 isoform X1 n=1 Tax=Pocillopora verrucosa TaxID=203993 RepID=UPI00333EF0CB
MDYSRAKSPNIGNVLNARRLARRKLQRSAIREREKQEIEKKEEEEKESLAWKVLSEEQTQSLKELTVLELEVKLAEVLSIENYHISLPEACVLDYYVAGFWFAKEQNFTLQQISAFFTLLKEMLDNIKEKQFSLVDSIQNFKSLLAGIGVENCPLNGGLECFDVNQAKLITDYFTDSLFQHYKLYQFLFTQEPQEEVVISELEVEVPPLASIPFPPPLDEGMTEEMWREHVMTPPQSPQPEEQTEGEKEQSGEEAHSDNVAHSKDQTAENILSSIEPAQVKNIVKKVADEVLGNFQAEVEVRLKERETALAAKIGKLQPR